MFNKKEKNGAASGASKGNGPAPAPKPDDDAALRENMAGISRTIIVLSGKGGVGKSTVAVNLASSLAESGLRTGLLDIDVHGPSVPRLLGLEGQKIMGSAEGKLLPVEHRTGIKVVSVGFFLPGTDDAVIWRGPLKIGVIKQFLTDVLWGELDYLVVDSPPGTGDEPLSICQLVKDPYGAIIVTTPQDVAIIDVRKSISFCRQLNIPILGVIENMSGFICPHCGKESHIFKSEGGKKMAEDMDIPFLGSIPLEPAIVAGGDSGTPFHNLESEAAPARASFSRIVETITGGSNR
jgi:Mrp family chromosome partitioning ATPase